MAIYSMHISNVSRAASSNACAAAAYITGFKIKNERTGEIYNYGRKQRVLDVATHLPARAPSEWSDPAALVNAIEKYETKSNARVAKKIMVALPCELPLEAQKELMAEYCKLITKRGYGCVCAIHTDADNNNPHAHILIVNRPINNYGEFVVTKTKKVYVLDENGNRVPQIDKATGQQKVGKRNEKLWQRKTVKSNWIDERDALLELRKSWADACNKWLEPEEQIDHRSHEERGLRTCATIHEGYAARALEQRGGISERCEQNREIRALNDRILSLIAKVVRQQERDERAQMRAEQRQEIVDCIKDQARDVAKLIVTNTSNAKWNARHWWHGKAVPALVDAIKPTPQRKTKDDRWDDYQDRKHLREKEALEAAQRTQTVKEQPTPSQELQTPQRATEREIEPIRDDEEEYDYGLDDFLNECDKESELLAREHAQSRTQHRSHSHSR